MKKIYTITCLVLVTLTTSCTLKNDPLIGTWEFVDVSNDSSEDYDHFKSFITLSSDSTFIFIDRGYVDPINVTALISDENEAIKTDEGRIYFGNWSSKDSVLYFNIRNFVMKNTLTAKIHANDGKNLKIEFPHQKNLIDDSLTSKFKYRKIDYDDVSKSKNNFTSLELNKWRIKDAEKSNRAAIKAKVENALEFSISFLKFHQAGINKSAVTYYLHPLPFQLYSNGIALKSEDYIEDWYKIFYDYEDAEIAYSMLKTGFNNVAEIPDNLSQKPLKINIFILEETLKNIKAEN